MAKAELADLGCMNVWSTTPREYTKCVDSHHILIREKIVDCYNKYSCPECGIFFTVDSSG